MTKEYLKLTGRPTTICYRTIAKFSNTQRNEKYICMRRYFSQFVSFHYSFTNWNVRTSTDRVVNHERLSHDCVADTPCLQAVAGGLARLGTASNIATNVTTPVKCDVSATEHTFSPPVTVTQLPRRCVVNHYSNTH